MKRNAPSAERNRGPILDVLRGALPGSATVLEVASGTGQHAVYLAAALPELTWQPSDPDEAARASIAAWREESGLPNVLPPLALDVRVRPWPVARADAVVAINLVHISPWTATQALMAGAADCLAAGGLLYLYGPYAISGVFTAESNAAFDADLRARNRDWGIRDVDDLTALAATFGLALEAVVPMPANNHSLLFRRIAQTG